MILILIFGVLVLVVNTYLMIVYIHPDDKGVGSALAYKVLVVAGMSVSFGLVLMLPLDVSNARHGGGLNMKDFWLAMYVAVFVLVVFLLPFGIFLYESDPDRSISARVCGAFLYELVVVAVSLAFLFISYSFCDTAYIPIVTIKKDLAALETGTLLSKNILSARESGTMEMKVSFPIYLLSCLAFLGYWIFVIFGGVGLTALPLDLIYSFINRPQMLSSSEAARKKKALKALNTELMDYGRLLKEEQKEGSIT